ncbi:hypothetical protein AV944_00585 [Sphingomonas sp. LK11]|nr:hypothetical protein AV944_00585 [Sphingomonas sp. LK11]
MTIPLSSLSAIGHAAEEELRAELAVRFPDARLIGAYEKALLRQMLHVVWEQRKAHHFRLRDEGESLSATEKRLGDEEAFRNGGRYRAIRAVLDAAYRAQQRFLEINPDRDRRQSVLDRISAWRFTVAQAHRAKMAILVAVRGRGEIGPRWRVGSNNPWGPGEACLFNTEATCFHCGAPGDDLIIFDGQEHCPSCGESWVVGDYHWLSLTDCLAYRDDREAGRVQGDEPNGWPGHFAMSVSHLVGMAA